MSLLTMDIVTAHQRIYNKIRAASVPVAIFIVSGKARETFINSSLYQEVSQTMPEKLLGIYDSSVDPEWLLNDLQQAESEARNEYIKSLRPHHAQ